MAPSWCRDDSVAMSAPPQRCSQRKTKSKRGSGGVKGNLNPQPTGVRVTSSRVYSVFLPIFAKTLTSAIRGSTFDRPRTNKTTFWVGPGRRFVRSSALCNGAISKFFLGLFVTAAPYDIFYLRYLRTVQRKSRPRGHPNQTQCSAYESDSPRSGHLENLKLRHWQVSCSDLEFKGRFVQPERRSLPH